MKRFILLAVLSLSLIAAYSYADKEGHMMDSGMMGSPGYGEAEKSGSESYGMMGRGMGPGMMNPGMMGSGMMGYGGCNMMGGMMGSGMGQGMMGHHKMMHGSGSSGMMGEVSSEEQQKFLNNTVDQLMMKRFDYSEALRNPETKPEAFKEIEKDMWELQKKITDKWYE
jgi:hypothetical protein